MSSDRTIYRRPPLNSKLPLLNESKSEPTTTCTTTNTTNTNINTTTNANSRARPLSNAPFSYVPIFKPSSNIEEKKLEEKRISIHNISSYNNDNNYIDNILPNSLNFLILHMYLNPFNNEIENYDNEYKNIRSSPVFKRSPRDTNNILVENEKVNSLELHSFPSLDFNITYNKNIKIINNKETINEQEITDITNLSTKSTITDTSITPTHGNKCFSFQSAAMAANRLNHPTISKKYGLAVPKFDSTSTTSPLLEVLINNFEKSDSAEKKSVSVKHINEADKPSTSVESKSSDFKFKTPVIVTTQIIDNNDEKKSLFRRIFGKFGARSPDQVLKNNGIDEEVITFNPVYNPNEEEHLEFQINKSANDDEEVLVPVSMENSPSRVVLQVKRSGNADKVRKRLGLDTTNTAIKINQLKIASPFGSAANSPRNIIKSKVISPPRSPLPTEATQDTLKSSSLENENDELAHIAKEHINRLRAASLSPLYKMHNDSDRDSEEEDDYFDEAILHKKPDLSKILSNVSRSSVEKAAKIESEFGKNKSVSTNNQLKFLKSAELEAGDILLVRGTNAVSVSQSLVKSLSFDNSLGNASSVHAAIVCRLNENLSSIAEVAHVTNEGGQMNYVVDDIDPNDPYAVTASVFRLKRDNKPDPNRRASLIHPTSRADIALAASIQAVVMIRSGRIKFSHASAMQSVFRDDQFDKFLVGSWEDYKTKSKRQTAIEMEMNFDYGEDGIKRAPPCLYLFCSEFVSICYQEAIMGLIDERALPNSEYLNIMNLDPAGASPMTLENFIRRNQRTRGDWEEVGKIKYCYYSM